MSEHITERVQSGIETKASMSRRRVSLRSTHISTLDPRLAYHVKLVHVVEAWRVHARTAAGHACHVLLLLLLLLHPAPHARVEAAARREPSFRTLRRFRRGEGRHELSSCRASKGRGRGGSEGKGEKRKEGEGTTGANKAPCSRRKLCVRVREGYGYASNGYASKGRDGVPNSKQKLAVDLVSNRCLLLI